jgi:hypothetical protein
VIDVALNEAVLSMMESAMTPDAAHRTIGQCQRHNLGARNSPDEAPRIRLNRTEIFRFFEDLKISTRRGGCLRRS